MPSSPPARQAAAPVRGGDESGLAPPEADPRGIDSRGVGCGDNWTGGGLRGKRLCCIDLICSSCLIRQLLRPQRAHLRRSSWVLVDTVTDGKGKLSTCGLDIGEVIS
mmetsp:Transcript_87491/g.138997  ORF Transcript_87491/g.138997 Transcript_87491/m.138997 type:complete len:107 (+) Transcript_87491:1102-1422(+)